MKRCLITFTLLVLILLPGFVYAAETPLCTVTKEYTLDMWHYGGGYWKVGNKGSDKITVSDSEMAAYDGLAGYLEARETARFEVDLPEDVKTAFVSGNDVRWELIPSGVSLDQLFNMDTLSQVSLDSEELVFTIKPRFNITSYKMSDYVSGLSVAIPLIDNTFGCNTYSVFGNGLNGIQFDGRFSASDPYAVTNLFIHPSIIADSSGKLKGGYSLISGVGSSYTSDGLRIGEGTFAKAGACGLTFRFPVGIRFYVYSEDTGGGDPEGGGDNPGTGGDDPEEEEHSISVDAVLDLPSETYEGHSAEAADCSNITYDGEDFTASEAYKKGIARSSISVAPSTDVTSRSIDSVTERLTFYNAGTYRVKLKVSAGSVSDTDSKYIAVKRCPYIMAALGGIQKQNRRQTLTGSVAQNPKYPITELTIVIRDMTSGEKITINKHLDGSSEESPVNSANIKYRTLVDNGSDEYYCRFALEFLSKFTEDRDFQYEIYARDSRGYTDTAAQVFTVVKDNPPDAGIDIEEKYYRGEKGNPAEIEVKDISTSDGDKLTRSWEYSADGTAFTAITSYEDLSFGSLQDICLKKADVGWFYIRLTVRDDWEDDTLPEYISEEDYLSDTVQVKSMVDNIAPKVSLSLSSVNTAEILLLASDAESLKQLRAKENELKMKLLESGTDAKISVASVKDTSSVSGRVTLAGTRQCSFGFQGRWPYRNSFWEMYSTTADEERFYKASCSWPIGEDVYDCYAAQPYIITAYDKNTLKTLWTFTLSKNFMDISFDEAVYGHDFEGRYLYIIAEGKTILVEKSTGAYVAVVNGDLGFNNSVTDRFIYAYKSDGIYRYPRSGGSPERIVSGTFFTDADKVSMIGGKVHILTKKGSRTYVLHFDPEKEGVTYTYLQGTGNDQNTLETSMLGFGSDGVTLISVGTQVRAFDTDGVLIKTLPGGDYADPVYDPSGKINYISVRSDSHYSYRGEHAYNATVSIYGINNSYSATQSITSENDYPTEVGKLCVSFENAGGVVYIGCGACFDYVRGLGMPYGQRFRIFTFNTKTGAKTNNDISSFASGLQGNIEYGYRTQGGIVLTTAYNLPGGGWNTAYFLNISESRADALARLKNKYLSYETDYSIVKELKGNIDVNALSEQISSEIDAGKKALTVTGTNPASCISSSFNLEAGKTYYYEYDTSADSDILSVTVGFTRNGTATEGYTVKKEYYEDFNDSEYESVFSIISGKVTDSAFYMVNTTAYGYVNKSGRLKFTVPGGYYGVLVFDYESSSSRGNGYSYFTLARNGGAETRWEYGGSPTGLNISGSYTSKNLLSSGSYILTGTMKSYSNFENNTCLLSVDNLRLLLLKKESYPKKTSEKLAQNSSISVQSGLNHVSGSFTAPISVQSYGLYETDCYSGGSSGESHSYTVPEGATALYYSYVVNSSPYYYYTSWDAYRSVSVSWLWGDDRWQVCASGSGGSSQAQSYPASGLRITKYNLTGTQTLQGSIPYRTSGNIASYRIIQSRSGAAIPSNITKGSFFLNGNALYYQDMASTGKAAVSLNTGSGNVRISNLRIYTIEDGRRVYLCDNPFNYSGSESGWTVNNASASVGAAPEEQSEPAALVYEKGDYIGYSIVYSDYENDPSKSSYWQYIHTPYNDGLNPISNAVLNDPVCRFYYDGKYELLHWEYDNCGKSEFDRVSNICRITFYIKGSAASAPWIEYISTNPSEIKPGDKYSIDVGIGDKSGKTLKLTVELYYEGELIETFVKQGIKPDKNGDYPVSRFYPKDPAKVGYYDVVATVSSDYGSDVDDYRFTVKSQPSLAAAVGHTEQWEKNRLTYNNKRFKSSTDSQIALTEYKKKTSPRLRYSNVFWPEERFMLTAVCGGEVTGVKVRLEGYDGTVTLTDSGMTDAEGRKIFTGDFWNESLYSQLRKDNPKEITFIFTASYKGQKSLTQRVSVIVDYDVGYFRIHRKW